jgi:MRG
MLTCLLGPGLRKIAHYNFHTSGTRLNDDETSTCKFSPKGLGNRLLTLTIMQFNTLSNKPLPLIAPNPLQSGLGAPRLGYFAQSPKKRTYEEAMHTHSYAPTAMLPASPRSYAPTLILPSTIPGSPRMGVFDRPIKEESPPAERMQTRSYTHQSMAVHQSSPTSHGNVDLYRPSNQENKIMQTMQTQPIPSIKLRLGPGSSRSSSVDQPNSKVEQPKEPKKIRPSSRTKVGGLGKIHSAVSYSLVLLSGVFTYSRTQQERLPLEAERSSSLPKTRLGSQSSASSEQNVCKLPALMRDTNSGNGFQGQDGSKPQPTVVSVRRSVKQVPSDESASVPPVRRSGRRAPSDESVPTSNASQANGKFNSRNQPMWSIPGHPDWDVIRVLYSDDCLAPDRLKELPNPDHTYLDSSGRLKDPRRYITAQKDERRQPPHPKLAQLIKRGANKPVHALYYQDMKRTRKLPIAGVIREDWEEPEESNEEPDPRDSEVRDMSLNIFSAVMALPIQETNFKPQEEQFHARPSIKLIVPDHIKAILVDDWENVTKNLQLVPLPAAKPVNLILNDYLQFEKPRRQAGSAQADILDEVVAGLKEYFEKCVGRILLYR